MQIKNQWKRPRDWKVVAGVGAVAALGITGLVIANPADGSVPTSISLEERARIAETGIGQPIPPIDDVVDLSQFGDDLNSPFDDASPAIAATGDDDSTNVATTADAPAPPPPPADSPDDSPATPAPRAAASPDDSAPARGGGGGGGGGDDSGDFSQDR